MNFAKLLTLCLSFLFVSSAYASTFTFDYSYNGSSVTANQAPYGQSLAVGDTVIETLHAIGGYWQTTGGELWPLINISEEGTRTGDESFSFYANNILVGTQNLTGQSSSDAHIIEGYTPTAGLNFDSLVVSYLLTDSTSAINTFGSAFDYLGGSLYFGADFIEGNVPSPSAVPLPAAAPLMLSGLGLLGFARRRKETSSVET